MDSLAARMVAAAGTIVELNTRYRNGSDVRWSASELRRAADVVEAEDREAETRDRQIYELAKELFLAQSQQQDSAWRHMHWEDVGDRIRVNYCNLATHVLDKGWSKDD
jgi:hypothetical protein